MEKYIQVAKELINTLNLNLNGLSILTECASNGYAFTPIIAALSGAKEVIAVGSDSRYGTFSNNKEQINAIGLTCGIKPSIIKYARKKNIHKHDLSHINIVTNSGQLRPINKHLISKLSPTAVVSLMWETWEFRNEDIDIKTCLKHKIPVIGTNENYPPISMFGYNPFIVIKLLFDLGLEVYNNTIVLLGGGKSGIAAHDGLSKLGVDVKWYTKHGENTSKPYSKLEEIYHNTNIDAIINFEHEYSVDLFGENTKINLIHLKERYPHIVYGHICGKIDQKALENSRISFLPKKILPFGFMSYETINLGNRPVLELSAMGLKVGQIAANERLNGKSLDETIKATVDFGVGQDFEDGFMNFNPKKKKI